jgi:hypothetical protein
MDGRWKRSTVIMIETSIHLRFADIIVTCLTVVFTTRYVMKSSSCITVDIRRLNRRRCVSCSHFRVTRIDRVLAAANNHH